MIIDQLSNARNWFTLGANMEKGLRFLMETDLQQLAAGKYEIDGESVFALVQEYTTKDPAGEKMEAHKRYADIQYLVYGKELIGLSVLHHHSISQAYSEAEDYLLYADKPDFYLPMEKGVFAIFYPTDLHMPCLQAGEPEQVKKIVVKVAIAQTSAT